MRANVKFNARNATGTVCGTDVPYLRDELNGTRCADLIQSNPGIVSRLIFAFYRRRHVDEDRVGLGDRVKVSVGDSQAFRLDFAMMMVLWVIAIFVRLIVEYINKKFFDFD